MASASLLRHRDFVLLWGGQTISELGSEVSFLAIPLTAVLALHADAFQVGLVSTFQYLPFLLVGLVAGVWVDRWSKRGVLIGADAGRAILFATIPLAAALHVLTLTQLYATAFLAGVLTVFFDVAYQSYLPGLVAREQIVDANAKLETTRSSAQLVGPGAGGLLVGRIGAPTAVLADAASYVVSVISLLFIRTPEVVRARTSAPDMRRELREGLAFVLKHPVLRRFAACTGLWNLASNTGQAILILYAVRTVGLTPAQIGLWFAVGNVGTPFAAAAAASVARRLGAGRTLIASAVVGVVASAIIPAAPPAAAAALPLFITSQLLHSVGVIYNITQVSYRQALAPPRLQGRMNATMRFLVWGTIPIGAFLGGVLGGTIGLRNTLWVSAALTLTTLVPLLGRPVRTLRGHPAPVDETEPPYSNEKTTVGRGVSPDQ